MRTPLGTLALSLALALSLPLSTNMAGAAPDKPALKWHTSVVDSDQSFRGLDAVNARTAWVSGASLTDGGDAKVFLTTNAGRTWKDVSPPRTSGLSFRDVEAEDARTASVLAIGEGKASRIYRTTNGGRTWTETFRNTERKAFYNCMDFYPDGRRGLAVSDPVDGKFRIISTRNGGRSWKVMDDAGMPDSTGEANFSASGDCLTISGGDAWFGGGGEAARIYHSTDVGRTWTASESTIPTGEAAGVFALAFRSPGVGIAVGGDFEKPDEGVDAAASTTDGQTWTSGGDLTHLGEDVAWRGSQVIVVGEGGEEGGSSVSTDAGQSWQRFSKARFHTLDCTRGGACWAAGGDGRVGRL